MGTLYIVATPIGNLKDITFRAIETLQSVDRVVAEDTRVTKKLLDRYKIDKPLLSLHERSPHGHFGKVVSLIEEGENVAYVTDAGTPGISDPGARLVAMVRERIGEKAIIPIPGASAVTTALSASGFQGDDFVFLGFLPHKKGRQKLLDEITGMERVVVLYESPHRMAKLLGEIAVRTPKRKLVIARELTKLYEEIAAGTASEILQRFQKGDISICLMSKGAAIILLGFLLAFLPFTGFPAAVKMIVAVLMGLSVMAIGFLVRQERVWLTRALKGEHKTDAYTENSASYAPAANGKSV
jgi:16S rRNA (cytidine1402-2'-O)-methyltransferase